MKHHDVSKLIPCSLVVVVFLSLAGALNALEITNEPTGYRLNNYDDTVPDTLNGATRVTAVDIVKLRSTQDVIIVDVIPEHRRPNELPEGQLWFPVEHEGVAGALWLPDVGYGALSNITDAYFKHHLKMATGSKPATAMVFYCRIDCWMSWNAAKRALSYGYTNVYWFADGLDDWRFEGLETQILKPEPGIRH